MQEKNKLAIMFYSASLMAFVIYGGAFAYFKSTDNQNLIKKVATEFNTELQSTAVADAVLLAKQASEVTKARVFYYNGLEVLDLVNILESSYPAGTIRYFDTDSKRVSLEYTLDPRLLYDSSLVSKDVLADVSQGFIRVEDLEFATTVYHPVIYDDKVIAGLQLTLSTLPQLQKIDLAVNSAFSIWSDATRYNLAQLAFILAFLVLPTIVFIHRWLVKKFIFEPLETLSNAIDLNGEAKIPAYLNLRKDVIGISARKISELTATLDDRRRKADHLAYYDDLTGMPNISFYREKIYELISGYSGKGHKFAIIDVNIKNMKAINQIVGHINGDVVLLQLASRLHDLIRDTKFGGDAFICRGHGDQFEIITPVADLNEMKVIGEYIKEGLSTSYDIDGNTISTSYTVAGVMYPDHGEDYDALKKSGDLVLAAAKTLNSPGFIMYTDDITRMREREVVISAALEASITDGGIEMFYQPVIDMKTLEVVGAEALVRWTHPELGFISPEEFIPIAERNNLILPLSYLITDLVCEQRFEWLHTVSDDFTVAINISPVQLTNPKYYKKIVESIYQHHLKPKHIEIEITETAFLASDEEVLQCLQFLDKEGFAIWLDDFGTGYSSLSHLQNYPVSGIKVDRSFVMDIENQGTNITLVSAIVDLALKLGKGVVAEGIENNMQSIILQRLGAHYAQGYHFGKPMNAEDFEAKFLIASDKQNQGA